MLCTYRVPVCTHSTVPGVPVQKIKILPIWKHLDTDLIFSQQSASSADLSCLKLKPFLEFHVYHTGLASFHHEQPPDNKIETLLPTRSDIIKQLYPQ
jgi:hypothetical protein